MNLFKVCLPLSIISLGAMVSDSAQFLIAKESSLPIGEVVAEEYSDFLDAAQRTGCSICGGNDSLPKDPLNVFFMVINPLTKKINLAGHRKCYRDFVPEFVKAYIRALNKKYSGKNQKAILLAGQLGDLLKKAETHCGVKTFEQLAAKEGGKELFEEFFEEISIECL